MPKYVDADVLLEQMKLRRFFVGRSSDPICIIEDAPAADVEPIRHGRWVEINTGNPQWVQFGVPQNKCSECSSEFMNKTPFCPHCGAKMDEEENND